jgi:hypothetical protein
MGGLLQPTPVTKEGDSSWRTIALAVAIVLLLAVGVAFLLRSKPVTNTGPPPYARNLQLSDFKMSAAENFVGATVSYIDGSVANAGGKTVTHATVDVTFKDELGQIVQQETVPLKVLKTGGPYDEAVDLSASPLAPGQKDSFRLTFESISAQWNHQYPQLEMADVQTK